MDTHRDKLEAAQAAGQYADWQSTAEGAIVCSMTMPKATTSLRSAAEFSSYQNELALWLSQDVDEETALQSAGEALCHVAKELGVSSESLLLELRDGRPVPTVQGGTDRSARSSQSRAQRLTMAVDLLLRCYGRPPAR